ncbi:hypothetical protein AVEN_63050-1 [Araneus ventricosus]|uniref:Uncharacterized protein n=1 Tax=Araneus ventricosus TaxID=182803 RepID=A0A4Y2JK89_ARAVE|nr:hypothetical protein AVEN_63050-1 [Araneus ventricosus]
MATGRRDSSPGRLALALPSIWKKVRYRWSPHRMNTVDLGASTSSLSDAIIYPWIAQPPDGRPRSLSCQLPGPPLHSLLTLGDMSRLPKRSGRSSKMATDLVIQRPEEE